MLHKAYLKKTKICIALLGLITLKAIKFNVKTYIKYCFVQEEKL